VYYPKDLRATWPRPLALIWAWQYPQLFDADDLRLALAQPSKHFCEWFIAQHLYHRDGAHSLVEKYAYNNHRRKIELLDRILTSAQRDVVRTFRSTFKVQPPDLFVFFPGSRRFWFVEAKGPGDRLSADQRSAYESLSQSLGAKVEIYKVCTGE
jgi:hypothetical protein